MLKFPETINKSKLIKADVSKIIIENNLLNTSNETEELL